MTDLTSYEGAHCANCQAALQGEYCHHCGQSVHSVLRPVHGLFEEFFETFLHIDGRILHTLPALFLKPGFLTLEYFSGRRVRYIAPFRLMFVLCLLSFFALHLATELVAHRVEQRAQASALLDKSHDFAEATTPHEVTELLNQQLQTLEATRALGNTAITAQVNQAEQRLREQANARLADLHAPAIASSAPTPIATDGVEKPVPPVHISWLPDFANERLTDFSQQVVTNVRSLSKHHATVAQRQQAWDRFAAGAFGVLPGTMLVLVPVFALLLKLFYVFRRRLYMEHLIVSLHSHAFLFVSLLLIVISGMLSTWLKPHAAWLGYPIGWLQLPLMLWIPVYLLIMQKRIYRQGWGMTVVKYWFIGWFYFWMMVFALTVAAVLGLAH
ncbi:DUF3667 domain-containing protein [Dyella monticola]|uniref:DUF3667 domain-containing protein n=1 Tax=Dyella monticola TaxID=1927958 RepID=A0A370WSH8_9GAMM|nr:DUF3667 domain-containing protein [Dyella monticola]RDS79053.1 DUF3667 domain-containing protein [Dyella monticola]